MKFPDSVERLIIQSEQYGYKREFLESFLQVLTSKGIRLTESDFINYFQMLSRSLQ